nr:uncharacterized protein I203_05120 [Kwoniella mangroviensis CBS 8507]OCF65445.1 hypothetical protein I203_05120 [Kwoniella mangroviensis CBS 8507]
MLSTPQIYAHIAMDSSSSTRPSPRPAEGSAHRRRPSLTLSPHLAASHPVPVPSRHGTISNRSPRSAHETLSTSFSLKRRSKGSFSSLSLSGSLSLGSALLSSSADVFGEDDEDHIDVDAGDWLNASASEISFAEGEKVVRIAGATRVEEAVTLLLEPGTHYLLVELHDEQQTQAFFDYADLNTFLLLVLNAKPLGEGYSHGSDGECKEIVDRIHQGERIVVGDLCNISGKNPYYLVNANAPLRTFVQLYSRGVHRVAMSGGHVISHETVLRYLLGLDKPPSILEAPIGSRQLRLNLHPLISIPTSSSVLGAMQVMCQHGLRVLGVLDETRRTALTNESSPLLAPADEGKGGLISIVRVMDCARIVVPSEGKQALTLSLADLIKLVESEEAAGKERGEERMPIHTLPPTTTLIYACHLILATSSSRVFVRTDSAPSPLLSPTTEPPILPMSPAQLSPHCVLSIVDVFRCLVAVYT